MASALPRLPARSPIPDSAPTRQSVAPRLTFEHLPPEIHLLVSRQLIYPDALSLKHTCRYFFYLVDTGLDLKVDWLIQRRSLHLDCPNDKRCDLGSDLKFCRGSVRFVASSCCSSATRHPNTFPFPKCLSRLLMQRRREHVECESRPGLGCLVYGTSICAHRRKLKERCKRWLRSRLTIEVWWLLLVLAPVILGWLWVTGLLTLPWT